MSNMTVEEIAAWLNGDVVGNRAAEISRVAKIEEANTGDLTFLSNPKYERYLATTRASAVLISRTQNVNSYTDHGSLTFIKVDDPYAGFLKVLDRITPKVNPLPEGIHPTAVISKSARLGTNVAVGVHVVIEDGVTIGDNTAISHGCVVGREAQIGSSCQLYPNVTVYHQCRIGNRVTIHSGTVIGSDGFGFAPKPDGTYEKIPQLGIVVIEDDVEIGSNCSVDRATIGETRICRGVKLDNLIQIAHNCTVGENTVIAAQSGLAGSTRLGKNIVTAGQVAFAGHMEIADKSVFMARSGVTRSFTEPGQTYAGFPAGEAKKWRRTEAALRNLPEMVQEFRELQRKVAQFFEKLK
jgi:UDP-3-O-[3-hydroxymyristoyl] glucosamine N-acyltransferase